MKQIPINLTAVNSARTICAGQQRAGWSNTIPTEGKHQLYTAIMVIYDDTQKQAPLALTRHANTSSQSAPMHKQIPINLASGLCCTLHANPGVHSPYNIIDTPPRFRQTAFITIRDADKTTVDKRP